MTLVQFRLSDEALKRIADLFSEVQKTILEEIFKQNEKQPIPVLAIRCIFDETCMKSIAGFIEDLIQKQNLSAERLVKLIKERRPNAAA
jgi:EAL domain-containing protein (putative c-di-GMP-specific phosphodiesterase class I)